MKNYNPTTQNTLFGNEPFVSYYARNPQKEFDRIQKLAEETKGIVMPYLTDSYVEILQIEPHDFKSDKNFVFDLKDVKLVCTDNGLTAKTIMLLILLSFQKNNISSKNSRKV